MDCSHGFKSAELKGGDQNLAPLFNGEKQLTELDRQTYYGYMSFIPIANAKGVSSKKDAFLSSHKENHNIGEIPNEAIKRLPMPFQRSYTKQINQIFQ